MKADCEGIPLGMSKIRLIKELRSQTGLGLKAAKDAVEDYGRRQGIEWATGSSRFVWVLIAVAMLSALAGVFLRRRR